MNENFVSWLDNDEFVKALATIKSCVERTGDADTPTSNDYLTYLAVYHSAAIIVQQGKGEPITDIDVARSMIFNEEDNE